MPHSSTASVRDLKYKLMLWGLGYIPEDAVSRILVENIGISAGLGDVGGHPGNSGRRCFSNLNQKFQSKV